MRPVCSSRREGCEVKRGRKGGFRPPASSSSVNMRYLCWNSGLLSKLPGRRLLCGYNFKGRWQFVVMCVPSVLVSIISWGGGFMQETFFQENFMSNVTELASVLGDGCISEIKRKDWNFIRNKMFHAYSQYRTATCACPVIFFHRTFTHIIVANTHC